MTLDGTVEIITQSSNTFSIGDIIAIVVAIVSLLGVIISTILTNKTTKNISKENAIFQEKWNQKNIDASLTANARIEWIQNVRNTTAELLGYYFDILNTADSAKIEEALINSQQKTELLALYFGPESLRQKPPVKSKKDLLNTENNEGKNDILVSFIVDLAQRFSKYSVDIKKDRFNQLEQAVRDARNEAYQNATETFIGYSYTPDGDEIPNYEPELQEEDIETIASTEYALKVEKEKIKELRSDLILLRNAMRIYLKIEWNKAKIGA